MNLPVPVEFGAGCIEKLPAYLVGIRSVLLVTGRTAMRQSGVTDKLVELLSVAGIDCKLFEGASPDPDYIEAAEAGELARSAGVDLVIGCGGGSAIDAAKAAAVVASHPGSILDYTTIGDREITSKTLPIIAISSTSGTGSHIGRASVLSDRSDGVKRVLLSDELFPRAAFCDPLILRHMPPNVTAATGFDAFAQSIEGYLSNSENPLGNMAAIESMPLIVETLSSVMADGGDLSLRGVMAWCDTLAGISLATNAISTPHVLSMVIGARYGATHGPAIASVMVAWLRHLRDRNIRLDKLSAIGRVLGGDTAASEPALADFAIDRVSDFISDIGLARPPADYGVCPADIAGLSREAVAGFSLRLALDPLQPNESMLADILREACGH